MIATRRLLNLTKSMPGWVSTFPAVETSTAPRSIIGITSAAQTLTQRTIKRQFSKYLAPMKQKAGLNPKT